MAKNVIWTENSSDQVYTKKHNRKREREKKMVHMKNEAKIQ